MDLENEGIRTRVALLERTLNTHMISCERRGLRLERLAWLAVTIMLSVLGLLLKAYLHL